MWTGIKNWLIGNMGTGGDYTFGTIHLLSILFVVLATAGLTFWAWRLRHREQALRRLIHAVAWFQLGFELFWRVCFWALRGDSLVSWWPLYPCNLGGILVPMFALMDLRQGKKLFYLFGFVGGLLTFAIPNGIFCNDVLVFPILKSILQHTGLLIIPFMEFFGDTFRPRTRDLGWVCLGCCIHILNSEGITRLLGKTGDYMFFRSGMPFVIPGVPQFITLSVFAVAVLAVLSLLCDLSRKRHPTRP